MAQAGKKRDARKAVHQTAWITLEGGFAARQCVVMDLSANGAKISVDTPQPLNSKLRLAFSRDARTGRSCEVVWRRGKAVGLKYTQS
uniref:Type IV pilus assembly PilZ n=1 Tax=Rhodopseudomonas palustris (strain BisA53) TaxID=316055 RepID=Q07MH6_RHOP5